MKKFRLYAVALLASAAFTSSFGQAQQLNNWGTACGCPTVSTRTPQDVRAGNFDADSLLIPVNLTLTCDRLWTFTGKLYIPEGKTLTIMPGTVLKGANIVDPEDASAIIVMPGGKIIADGTASCPILMTTGDDPVDGSYPITSRGKWGGLVLLGRAQNNLIAGNKYCYVGDGVGFVEGYDKALRASGGTQPYKNLYGRINSDGTLGTFDDNDNSGILRYVSVRHAGAVLELANELNGITLGSVGRGTVIDNVEIVSNDDDGIEFFGGTVNTRHVAMFFGNDDMFDWDLNWRGNGQFLFGIQCPDNVVVPGGDNGFESDGDDDKKSTGQYSRPVIYNATLIGDGTVAANDKTGPSAFRAKDRTQGEIYNSIFANFLWGFDVNDVVGATIPSGQPNDAFDFWFNDNGLILKNNLFVNMTDTIGDAKGRKGMSVTIVLPPVPPAITGVSVRRPATEDEYNKFLADGNEYVTILPGFDYGLAMSGSTITAPYDAIPNPEIIATQYPTAAQGGGFFYPVRYKGAFSSSEQSWLSEWAAINYTGVDATNGVIPCPTDLDKSGSTGASDLNKVLGSYGVPCGK